MRSISLLLIVLVCGVTPLLAGTICPGVTPDPGITDASGCNVLITITNSGTTAVTVDLHPYEMIEDQLVGVINNSTSAVTSIPLSGSSIFGFEGDGICSNSFIPASNCTSADSTGYGPNGVTFTINNPNSGVVNFSPGIAAGGKAFFSLEAAPSSGGVVVGGVPEPGTLGMLGTGLLAAGFWGRRSLRRRG